MPKAAIFFIMILFSPVLTNSFAFVPGDTAFEVDISQQIDFSSGIVQVDSDFFTENNFKRYIIFGTNSQNSDFLKNNSIYGIQSNNGFFYVSVLSDKSASNLLAQGYNVVEDFKLYFVR